MTYYLDCQFAQFVIFAVRQRLRRCHHYTLARVDAERVEVLHVAHCDTVVEGVAHHFVFHFLPALYRLFDQNLVGIRECVFGPFDELLARVAESGAHAAERVGGAHHYREAYLLGCLQRVLDRRDGDADGRLDVDFGQLVGEDLAVFGVDDRLDGRAEHLNIILFEHAVFEELDAAVQCGLAAKGKQDAVGFLFFDDLLHEIWSHRQEVDPVGNVFRRLNGRNVRIHQNRPDALFLESLQGLRAGVVELAGLAYLQRAGT